MRVKNWFRTEHSKTWDHGILSHQLMANRWGKSVRFHFLGLQNYCGWWLQPYNKKKKKIKHLFLGREAMTHLDNILKGRDITLPTNVLIVKVMVFLVAMYECESWTIKKAECQRIDAFKLWCWRRLLRVPQTGNQSWIFIGRADAEAQTSILWPPGGKSQLNGKDPVARKDWREVVKEVTENEMIGWQHWLNGHSLSKLREIMNDREAWHAAFHGVKKT